MCQHQQFLSEDDQIWLERKLWHVDPIPDTDADADCRLRVLHILEAVLQPGVSIVEVSAAGRGLNTPQLVGAASRRRLDCWTLDKRICCLLVNRDTGIHLKTSSSIHPITDQYWGHVTNDQSEASITLLRKSLRSSTLGLLVLVAEEALDTVDTREDWDNLLRGELNFRGRDTVTSTNQMPVLRSRY